MKTLLIVTLLAIAIVACSSKEAPDGITLPTYACTQAPTGEVKVKEVKEYCGRYCSQMVPYTYYAVKITCEYTEWRLK